MTSQKFRSPYPILGLGEVSIGGCVDSGSDMPGLLLTWLPEARAIGESAEDILPDGSTVEPEDVAACIYFSTPESLDMLIATLVELRDIHFPHDNLGNPLTSGWIHYEDGYPTESQWSVVLDDEIED